MDAKKAEASNKTEKSELIRYNINDRGRTHSGIPRKFDVAKIVRVVNSPATQERVKNRDMLGYYGHWPRLKFGMRPSEGGVVNGKQVSIEPALVTTHLKAYDDGTIEHMVEFIDTDAGRLAKTLHGRKVGGFSSAIDGTQTQFFGFDYVLEPNFSSNRGYEMMLDSANESMLDDAAGAVGAYQRNIDEVGSLLGLLDSVSSDHLRSLEVIDRLTQENEQYLSMLACRSGGAGATLDSAATLEGSVPVPIEKKRASALLDSVNEFKNAKLVGFDPLKADEPKEDAPDRSVSHVLRGLLG